MKEYDIKKIVKEAAKEAVNETFVALGLNVDEPRETQADLLYLRKIRRGSEFLTLRVKASLIAFLIPTFLYLAWEILRKSFNH